MRPKLMRASTIAKLVRPLGWDWEITVEIAGKPAMVTDVRPAERTAKGHPSFKTVNVRVDGKSDEYSGRYEFKVLDLKPIRRSPTSKH